jgi:hypothetical protein
MSAETDAWRVAETRRMVKDFLELFYDDDRSDTEKNNIAVFALGSLSAVVLMSDAAVERRMADGSETPTVICPPEVTRPT